MFFKTGDIVFKARPYRAGQYCCYGGDPETVPLGTRGVVGMVDTNIKHKIYYSVRFSNGIIWQVDGSELDLISPKKKQIKVYPVAQFCLSLNKKPKRKWIF